MMYDFTGGILWAILGQWGGKGWGDRSQRLEIVDAPARKRRMGTAQRRWATPFRFLCYWNSIRLYRFGGCDKKKVNYLFVCPQRKKRRRKKKRRRRWRIAVSHDTQSGWMWSRLGRQLTGCPGGLTKPRVSLKRTVRIQTDRCSLEVSLLSHFTFHIHSKYV